MGVFVAHVVRGRRVICPHPPPTHSLSCSPFSQTFDNADQAELGDMENGNPPVGVDNDTPDGQGKESEEAENAQDDEEIEVPIILL